MKLTALEELGSTRMRKYASTNALQSLDESRSIRCSRATQAAHVSENFKLCGRGTRTVEKVTFW